MDGVFSDCLTPILEPGCDGPGIPGEKRDGRRQHGAYGATNNETTPPVADRRS